MEGNFLSNEIIGYSERENSNNNIQGSSESPLSNSIAHQFNILEQEISSLVTQKENIKLKLIIISLIISALLLTTSCIIYYVDIPGGSNYLSLPCLLIGSIHNLFDLLFLLFIIFIHLTRAKPIIKLILREHVFFRIITLAPISLPFFISLITLFDTIKILHITIFIFFIIFQLFQAIGVCLLYYSSRKYYNTIKDIKNNSLKTKNNYYPNNDDASISRLSFKTDEIFELFD